MVLHKEAFHEIITLSHSLVNNYYIDLLVGKCISAFQTHMFSNNASCVCVCFIWCGKQKCVCMCDLYALNSAINVLKSVCLYLRLFKSKPQNTVTLSAAAAPKPAAFNQLEPEHFPI